MLSPVQCSLDPFHYGQRLLVFCSIELAMLRERRGLTHAELLMALVPLAFGVDRHHLRLAQMYFLRHSRFYHVGEGAADLGRVLERRNITA